MKSMHKQTQELVNEATAARTQVSDMGLEGQMVAFLSTLRAIDQLAASRESLARMVEIVEQDEVLRGKMPAHLSKCRVIRQGVAQIEKQIRDVATAVRGLDKQAEEIIGIASQAPEEHVAGLETPHSAP